MAPAWRPAEMRHLAAIAAVAAAVHPAHPEGDDVFAELDDRRRARLAALVSGAEQVLVTAAVAQDVPQALEGARFDVMAGEVRRVR